MLRDFFAVLGALVSLGGLGLFAFAAVMAAHGASQDRRAAERAIEAERRRAKCRQEIMTQLAPRWATLDELMPRVCP